MRLFMTAGLAVTWAAAAFSQADHVKPNQVQISSQFQASNGASRILRGNVEIQTANVTIRADRAIYNAQTGDIQASGRVQIHLNTAGR